MNKYAATTFSNSVWSGWLTSIRAPQLDLHNIKWMILANPGAGNSQTFTMSLDAVLFVRLLSLHMMSNVYLRLNSGWVKTFSAGLVLNRSSIEDGMVERLLKRGHVKWSNHSIE